MRTCGGPGTRTPASIDPIPAAGAGSDPIREPLIRGRAWWRVAPARTRSSIIRFDVAKDTVRAVGNLGRIRFPPGHYLYAGNGAVRPRAAIGAPRSHLDHILPFAADARALPMADDDACALAVRVARATGALPVIGVGVTACECLTHLFGFLEPDVAPTDAALLKGAGSEPAP